MSDAAREPASAPADHPTDPVGPTVPVGSIVVQGLILGISADLLLRDSIGPALNMVILFVGLALALLVVEHRAGMNLSREAGLSILVGLLFATGIALRGDPALRILAFLAAAAAFTVPAYRAGAAWIRSGGGLAEQAESILGAMAYAGLGSLRLGAEAYTRRPASGSAESTAGRLVAILRGLLLAAPLLLVFGALFMEADAVFARLVTDLLRVNLDEVLPRVVTAAFVAWLASGYLTGFVHGTGTHRLREVVRLPSVGIVEVATLLAVVDLLFATFVAVQLRYLFGGAGLVEVTPGLTYAEYARAGFVQLAVASALVLPSLTVADVLLRRERDRDERVFRALGGLQLALLAVIIASALVRVQAYVAAYGLTESRFYGSVFLIWLVLLSAVFGITVLRSRRDRFAFPALLSAYAFVGLLFVLNPDAHIARTNLARADLHPGQATAVEPRGPSTGSDSPSALDVAYLGSLGADAVPTLLRALPDVPAGARCTLASALLQHWGQGTSYDWRSWNLAEARARRLVEGEARRLRALTGAAECP